MIQPIRTQKAQMKMGETIMVLLAFFMLLGIGLVIYANFQKTSILRQASETFEREAVRIALKTAFYPEFACSEGGVVNENCFDIHKVRAFGKLSDLSEEGGGNEAFFLFHETELRDSKIYIEQIFPPPNVELGEWEEDDDEQLTRVTIYDNSPTIADEGFSWESFPTFIPITIRDDTQRKAEKDSLGMLVVEVYRTRFG